MTEPAQESGSSVTQPAEPRGALRILIAEDVPSDAELVARTLRTAGMDFVMRRVDTAEAFKAELDEFSPQIILSDYSMPSFDGLAALAISLERAADTPFIIVTGSLNEETAVRCIKAGADDYILKDRTARLPSAIEAAIEKKRLEQERRLARLALRASEERFRALIENSSDGIFLIERGARISYVSPSSERVLGYKPDEVVGQDARQFLHADDRTVVTAMLEKLTLEPGKTTTAVFRSRRRDGNWAWIEATARNALSEPAIQAIVVNYRDVTESRQTMDALRESELRYREIFENTSECIFLLDVTPDGRFRLAGLNPAEEEAVGFSSAYSSGKFLSDVISEPIARDAQANYRRCLNAGTLISYDEELDLPPGKRSFHTTLIPIRNAAGDIYRIVGIAQNFTERRRLEEEMRRLVAAIEQVAETVMITDLDGVIEYVNPAFTSVTGYSREEALGKTPRILQSGKHDQEFYRNLWTTLKNGETWHGHLINRRKDGTLYEEDASISPVRDENGTFVRYVAVKRDVTQEIALESQLRQSQKMEAVGMLAGGIAHDFNNLLQALLTQAQLLGRISNDPEKVKTTRANMERQIKHGASLTRRLLLFARKDVARTQLLDLNETIQGAVTLLKQLVRANVALVTDLAPASFPVTADRSQLEQVLVNLVVNAVDAMPDGGQLVIRSGGETGPWVWFAVDDSGVGIAPEIRDRVFEPFFTTKREKGTGLGLSVVHGIVTQLGGTVEVRDRAGAGTTFLVRLPRSQSRESAAAEPQASPQMPMGHGERILIVEDEDDVRQSLTAVLEALGYVVTIAAGSEEVMKLGNDPPFDLMLTDLMLPDMQGLELAAIMTARWPKMQVILMSGYAEEAARESLNRKEGRFLQKPFGAHELAVEVHDALAQRGDHSSR